MKFGWIDIAEVIDVLKNRPGFQQVKHPYDEGIRGQQGIEW
jgi:ATP:corrinoid adenosyltransferase